MGKTRLKFSDEIRKAVDAASLTRYRICKEIGVSQSLLSRFMSGENWLGQGTMDRLAELLDLHVAGGKAARKKE
jgi:transcriptional regulator with XRE-family HTH domain